jgi:hypothetical protein
MPDHEVKDLKFPGCKFHRRIVARGAEFVEVENYATKGVLRYEFTRGLFAITQAGSTRACSSELKAWEVIIALISA